MSTTAMRESSKTSRSKWNQSEFVNIAQMAKISSLSKMSTWDEQRVDGVVETKTHFTPLDDVWSLTWYLAPFERGDARIWFLWFGQHKILSWTGVSIRYGLYTLYFSWHELYVTINIESLISVGRNTFFAWVRASRSQQSNICFTKKVNKLTSNNLSV